MTQVYIQNGKINFMSTVEIIYSTTPIIIVMYAVFVAPIILFIYSKSDDRLINKLYIPAGVITLIWFLIGCIGSLIELFT